MDVPQVPEGTITFFVSEMQAGFKMDEVLCLQNFFISITIESVSRNDDFF